MTHESFSLILELYRRSYPRLFQSLERRLQEYEATHSERPLVAVGEELLTLFSIGGSKLNMFLCFNQLFVKLGIDLQMYFIRRMCTRPAFHETGMSLAKFYIFKLTDDVTVHTECSELKVHHLRQFFDGLTIDEKRKFSMMFASMMLKSEMPFDRSVIQEMIRILTIASNVRGGNVEKLKDILFRANLLKDLKQKETCEMALQAKALRDFYAKGYEVHA